MVSQVELIFKGYHPLVPCLTRRLYFIYTLKITIIENNTIVSNDVKFHDN